MPATAGSNKGVWQASRSSPPPPPPQPTSAGCQSITNGRGWPPSAQGAPRRETAASTTAETAYYLLSIALSLDRLEDVTPSHLGIENQLRWRLDVVMNEEQDRTRLGHGPENLPTLRHMVRNVIQAEPSKGSLHGELQRAGCDGADLTKIVELFEVR